MSLNGLDSAKVTEAYKAALADSGGWFLLKYISRDEVDLLKSGGGGVVEIRNVIEQYTEKSPLYGFIQYRRRKVLLKYLPDGTSRLLQVRVNVHFQSVIETFTPHDTTFSLTSSEDLTDTALSSACALHTASGSLTSSSSSLRRRRLNEITEDAAENGNVEQPGQTEDAPTSGRNDASAKLTIPRSEPASQDIDGVRPGQVREKFIENPDAQSSAAKPEAERSLTSKAEETTKASNQKQLLDLFAQNPEIRRQSSQSTRPTAKELDYSSPYKPKVKLGPRPSLDMRTRPQTSGSTRQYETRPVATLPAGIRAAPRRTVVDQRRPKSQGAAASTPFQSRSSLQQPPPVPMMPIQPLPSPTFYSNVRITPSPKMRNSSPKTPGVTPEKQRLMKALHLRKKQMENSSHKDEVNDQALNHTEADVKDVRSTPVAPGRNSAETTQGSSELEAAISPLESLENRDHGPGPPAALKEEQSTEDSTLPPPESSTTPGLENEPPVAAKDAPANEPSTSHLEKPRDILSYLHGMTGAEEGAESTNEPSEELISSERKALLQDKSKSQTVARIFLVDETIAHSKPTNLSHVSLPEPSEVHSLLEGSSCTDDPKQAPQDPIIGTLLPKNDQKPVEAPIAPQPSERSPEESWLQLISPEVDSFEGEGQAVPSLLPLVTPNFGPESVLLSDSTETEKASTTKNDSLNGESDGTKQESDTQLDEKLLDPDDLSLRGGFGGRQTSTRPSSGDTGDAYYSSEKRSKRHGFVDPTTWMSSAETSDDNLLSDDSFIEELKSARVEEAKPVSVSKSPIQPFFPLQDSEYWPNESLRTSRMASTPFQSGALPEGNGSSPIYGKARTVSGRSIYDPNHQPSPGLSVKKVNVSSGISKRIKALEMFTSRDSSPIVIQPQSSTTSPSSSSPFAGFRNSISRTISKDSGAATKADSASKAHPSLSFPEIAVPNSPQHGRKLSTTSSTKGKRNSVSVTARIIRDPSDAKIEAPMNPSEPTSLTLHKSPLIVERENSDVYAHPAVSINSEPRQSRLSLSSASESRRESNALMPKSEPEINRLSLSSRSRTDPTLPHSASDASSIGISSIDEGKEDRKESRRSRLIKRMSLITNSSRRSLVGAFNPPKQENLLEGDPIMESEPEPPAMVDIGDVNVQFPDSLLWKRRFMRIDDQGYLVLDPSSIDDKRATTKRYHLSEFRRPFIPDQDREELPNSILLDFCDGSTLQCACESRRGQSEILHTLVNAHRAYHQLYSS